MYQYKGYTIGRIIAYNNNTKMTKTIIASTKQVEKGYIGVITVLSERQYMPLWYAMTRTVRQNASTAHKDATLLRESIGKSLQLAS